MINNAEADIETEISRPSLLFKRSFKKDWKVLVAVAAPSRRSDLLVLRMGSF